MSMKEYVGGGRYNPTIRNDIIQHLVLADTYDLPRLHKHCISESSKLKLNALERRPDYPKLEPSTLIEVLKSMLRARDEEL